MRWGKRLLHSGILLGFALLLGNYIGFSGGVFTAAEEGAGSEEASAANTCRIRVTYPVEEGISDVTDLQEVQDAVNEITAEEIGVEVELIPEDSHEASEDYLLWLSRGETVDLMLLRGQDITSYIDKGMLNALNGYLKRSGSWLNNYNEAYGGTLCLGAEQQGRIYGVSNLTGQDAYGYGLWISQSLLDEVGFLYEEERVYSLDEIELLLARLKAQYPDSYPLGQITARQSTSAMEYYLSPGDALGGGLCTGVVQGDSDMVENVFATKQYRDLLTHLRRWYQEEYLYPDGAVYDASALNLLEDNTILMLPASSYPGTMDLMMGRETDYVCLRTTEVYEKQGNAQDGFWTIPVTSRYPEEAMKFLELCYSNRQIAYLMNYGISGEHFQVSDWENRLLTCTGNEEDGGFYNPFARIGDTRDLYAYGTPQICASRERYCENAAALSGRYRDFIYSTSGMSRQIESVRKTVALYAPILESGSVDLEENYQEFLAALQQAGIDDIIADKQAQLDAWLARQTP